MQPLILERGDTNEATDLVGGATNGATNFVGGATNGATDSGAVHLKGATVPPLGDDRMLLRSRAATLHFRGQIAGKLVAFCGRPGGRRVAPLHHNHTHPPHTRIFSLSFFLLPFLCVRRPVSVSGSVFVSVCFLVFRFVVRQHCC